MNKSIFATLTVTIFTLLNLSQFAAATNLMLRQGNRTIENVIVAPSALSRVDNHSVEVSLLGAGLFTSNFLIFTSNEYVAQMYSSEPEKFARTSEGALESLNNMNEVVIQLSFLSDIKAKKFSATLAEALEKNDYDLNSTDLKSFLDSVSQGNNAISGRTVIITGRRLADGSDLVVYSDCLSRSTSIVGPHGFTNAIMSIWLGVPVDKNMQKLKSEILGE
jgi:hypothetical protein